MREEEVKKKRGEGEEGKEQEREQDYCNHEVFCPEKLRVYFLSLSHTHLDTVKVTMSFPYT